MKKAASIMRKVKSMLLTILVLAIVAGALAFKVKSPNVCGYTKTITLNPPATTLCNLQGAGDVIPGGGANTEYAATISTSGGSNPCPFTLLTCSKNKTLFAE